MDDCLKVSDPLGILCTSKRGYGKEPWHESIRILNQMTPTEAYYYFMVEVTDPLTQWARISDEKAIELEDIIMTDSYEIWRYARDFKKGRLPDKMHNMMLLHAMENPDRACVRNYFNLIKDKQHHTARDI